MRQFFDNAIAAVGSLALHGLLVWLLFARFEWTSEPPPPVQTTIKARIVSDVSSATVREPTPAPVVAESEPDDAAAEARALAEREARETAERQAREQAEREAREAEARAAAELKAQQEAERKAREAAELEARKQAEREARELAERQAREEAERKAREEAERKAREEAERKAREAAERKAREEAERRAREEAERRAAAERQAQLEAQMREAIEAEEARRGAIERGLQAKYIEQIRQAVRRNWNVPAGTPGGIICTAQVRQLQSGDVVSVRISDCPGSEALTRSLEAAVFKASPLPPPDDPSLFDANLRLDFNTSESDGASR